MSAADTLTHLELCAAFDACTTKAALEGLIIFAAEHDYMMQPDVGEALARALVRLRPDIHASAKESAS